MQAPRKIIHIDMDAFYASVELRDRPDLIDVPMIVAHDQPRSVVTTANYIARSYGLCSAMSVLRAKQLCPHVVCVAPNFVKYREVSQTLHHIFQRYTTMVEPISLDEAYLDVTDNLQGIASATEVAECIRADIFRETQLTASAGIAPNKFLAKIASDWNKPNGQYVVKPHQIQDFIHSLSLDKIPGVGRVTLQKLHGLGWQRIADIQAIDEHVLLHHFGKFGRHLFLCAQGIDERPVQYARERQQISKETTFEKDYYLSELEQVWIELAEKVWGILQQKNMTARGVQVKLKTNQFKTLQHSKSFKQSFENLEQLLAVIHILRLEFNTAPNVQFRLAGVGVFALEEKVASIQLSFL